MRPQDSILDHPAISGCYLFPQRRRVDDPFLVPVAGAELACYRNPLLVLHAEHDGLIDISHAERNYRWAASARKRLVRFSIGDHNSILGRNQEAYWAALREFVKLIEQP